MNTAHKILNSLCFKTIDQNWLTECIEFINETCPNNLEHELTRQILYSDLSDLVLVESLRIDGFEPCFVQVLKIDEIGHSALHLLEELENNKTPSRKMLKLLLSDGINQYEAVELNTIEGINLLSDLGIKVLID
jgi:hypothetical protein